MVQLRILPIGEWQRKIARHWNVENPSHISSFNNPFGMIRYYGREIFSRMLFFPVALEIDGRLVAYSSIYNISSTHLRIRGIFVEEGFRGQGLGHIIVSKMLELWPEPWRMVIGYFRPESWQTFEKHSGFCRCPHIYERISPFSKKPLILAQKSFEPASMRKMGDEFVKENIGKYGFNGSNNRLNKISIQNETDGIWGYDGVCASKVQRLNGRNIFFIDFDNFIRLKENEPSPHSFLRIRNLSYDPFQKKKIGVDDWAIEFREPEVVSGILWRGKFWAAIEKAKQESQNFESSFLIDSKSQVHADHEDETGHLSANFKHYIPLSRFSDQSENIIKVYGTV